MEGLLSDLVVVEVANEFGEWTGRLLADLGARVIKVEPPSGSPTRQIGPFHGDQRDPERSIHFWHYNAGKESVALDLESESGRKAFKRLIDKCDVLVETFRPGQMAAWGISYEDLSKSNPGLIMVSITPFGQTGPRKDWLATDLTAMAMGVIMSMCGYDDHSLPPVMAGGGQSYHTAGEWAAMGILTAVIQRMSTGRGQQIDVPVHACVGVATERGVPSWLNGHENLLRQTNRHAYTKPTPTTQHRCADGRYVHMHDATVSPLYWPLLIGWLAEDGLAGDLAEWKFEDMESHPELGFQLLDSLGQMAARHNAEEIFLRAQKLGLPWGIVRRPEEWLDDPHATARELFVPIEHAELGKTFRYQRAPYSSNEGVAKVRVRAPHLGEHNELILAALGLAPEDSPIDEQ